MIGNNRATLKGIHARDGRPTAVARGRRRTNNSHAVTQFPTCLLQRGPRGVRGLVLAISRTAALAAGKLGLAVRIRQRAQRALNANRLSGPRLAKKPTPHVVRSEAEHSGDSGVARPSFDQQHLYGSAARPVRWILATGQAPKQAPQGQGLMRKGTLHARRTCVDSKAETASSSQIGRVRRPQPIRSGGLICSPVTLHQPFVEPEQHRFVR
jgi:hypothetical protein